jgi:16S rRNA (guanine527-N7)-methyltransferase
MNPKPVPKPSKLIPPDRLLNLPKVETPTLPMFLEIWQETLDWQPNHTQLERFQALYAIILAGNHLLNLTRITEPEEFWEKHLWDSLRGIRSFLPTEGTEDGEQGIGNRRQETGDRRQETEAVSPSSLSPAPLTVIDIGTGAGFPGIPVAIARPDWQITLLDSTHKKIQFLNQLLELLQLTNGQTLVDRVEAVGQSLDHRAAYDLALVRAVASTSVCAEYALPLLKVDGLAILYRGQWSEVEAEQLKSVVQQLGGTLERVEAFQTPLTGGDRHCLYLRKVTPTPAEFPRMVGIAVQKPLT